MKKYICIIALFIPAMAFSGDYDNGVYYHPTRYNDNYDSERATREMERQIRQQAQDQQHMLEELKRDQERMERRMRARDAEKEWTNRSLLR